MATVTMYANQSAKIAISNPTTNYSSDASVTDGNLLISFSGFPASEKFKAITRASVAIYANLAYGTDGQSCAASADFLAESFAEKSVTYNTAPKTDALGSVRVSAYVTGDGKYATGNVLGIGLEHLRSLLVYGLKVSPPYRIAFQTSRGSNKPYISVEYSDEIVGLSLSNLAPSSGSIVPANVTTFSWAEAATGVCYESITRASAKFCWRKSASDTVKEIVVPGTATSITIPANTFSGDSIQWQISATSNSGVTTTSDWMTLSLTDVESTAVAVAPDRAVLDGSSDNVFKWEHVISTGTAQTKAELQQSTDGSTWTALATVTGAANTWTAPAGTFTSGTKYWRVRTYNSRGAAGAWSAAKQFIVLAAPATPPVSIVSTEPRPDIRWQSDEQQAYQVEIDGVYASGTRFGTGKTWKAPFYLADGNYTVRVRVQNEYGFWSPWGTAALPVTNVPGGAITLTASTENAVTLVWVDSGNYDFYIVYRDGTPIAKAEGPGYVDNMAIGACTYQVRGCYSDNDYYGVSAEVSVSVTPEYNGLYDMDAGEWLTMKYSGLTNQPVTRSISRSIAEVRLSGYTYPVAERSKAKTATYDGNVVFLSRDSAEKFEGMIGHLVCLKLHPSGGCIGYLNEVSGEVNQYKSVYSFMVTQIEYEEEIDIDS
nr:MAG TPA: Oligo alginate lyase [Caudoviricetes sp.]